ncbi:Rrf2 family transcriptional regulator [Sodalis sp. dw_96]|uniref:RrF2 family transcriptional regulator n=1 Tax=Sodalis sp. dw_96 TaxID=2719794 RepID=UPI001BD33FAD|nr:Rrf2 family transcriptional regulator [Sodalis sp. dw_96]
MIDLRFPTALQMVLSVANAEQNGTRATSAVLATGLQANPSFVRKLMVPLTRGGIIISTHGRQGSIHLGRPADRITLQDIYLSVTEDKPLWGKRPEASQCCLVTANTGWFFDSLAGEAEQACLEVLARRTVADALRELQEKDRRPSSPDAGAASIPVNLPPAD